MIPKPSRFLAALTTATLILAACGGDDDDESTATDAPAATGTPTTPADTDRTGDTAGTADTESPGSTDADAGGEAWTVSTDDCIDPDAANAPIEGTVKIAAAMPLSGGPAAAAFSPVAAGLQAYIDYANEQGLLADHELELTIGDDQYDPALTPGVISSALDGGAHLFSGVIGTPNNLAVRDTLNEECVPQILSLTGNPAIGDVAGYPWTTTSSVIPYDLEPAAYAADLAREFPDGATMALFYVNNEAGQGSRDAFRELAEEYGFEIVDEQTIEPTETAPPAAQVSSIAGNAPDAIAAFPLGAQCPTFLTEVANAKAANAGWEPRVYLTATCASPLILEVAGAAADGLYTVAQNGAYDVMNPANAEEPGVAEYLAQMESRGLTDTIPSSVTGWITGELTVEILRQAADSPEGLTRASILNTARNFDYTAGLARPGVSYKTSGEDDAWFAEEIQIIQYDADAGHFTDIGELITDFRTS